MTFIFQVYMYHGMDTPYNETNRIRLCTVYVLNWCFAWYSNEKSVSVSQASTQSRAAIDPPAKMAFRWRDDSDQFLNAY